MPRFKITDKHIGFVNDIAAGMKQYEAYMKHFATGPILNITARTQSSRILRRKEVQDLLDQAMKARQTEIINTKAREVAAEFSTTLLTPDELDAYHSAVVQGKVEMEEFVPVYQWQETLNKDGKVIARTKTANLMRVTRKPNIREKQISIDALYKRQGLYAASRGLFGFKNLGGEGVNDEPEDLEGERIIMLSNGSTIKMLPE